MKTYDDGYAFAETAYNEKSREHGNMSLDELEDFAKHLTATEGYTEYVAGIEVFISDKQQEQSDAIG